MLARNTAYEPERKPAYQQPLHKPEQSPLVKQRVTTGPGLTARQKLSWLATIGICSLVACFILSQYASITKKSYAIEGLNQQIQESTTKNGSLQEQVIALSSPNRIVEIALNKLHMTFGTASQGN